MRLRPTRMEVFLDSYRGNYRAIRDYVKPSKVICAIKADAYGMGAVPVAWTLKSEGADFFAVATPDEAVELREAGISDPVLVLGASPYDAAEIYVRLGISAAITDARMAEAISAAAARQNRTARVHLKIDSGMGRIGFLPDEALSAAEKIHKLPGLNLEGVFTHFSTSDSGDLEHTRRQFGILSAAVASMRAARISARYVHCCNSGALLGGLKEMFLDAVRPGHMLNGLIPSDLCGSAIPVKPCFAVKTAVGALRDLPTGTGISYGLTYTTTEDERVAVLPVGYVDGFSRSLSNKGEVLIRGRRCPVRGRICMDQTVVSVSHLRDVAVGDEAVLIGTQGGEAITVDEVAAAASTNTATVAIGFTVRVPKEYIDTQGK